ncbi:DUF6603 domain-containing protein [Citricoccus sp. CH26A]|uniref:DUF6603 domain-containing protein n=1 Tax=Citricoccus TaxID=169133 RepID=UPI0002F8AF27|nr:DUF6603 domain-containing protein [Citricoccus sp. CH26A]
MSERNLIEGLVDTWLEMISPLHRVGGREDDLLVLLRSMGWVCQRVDMAAVSAALDGLDAALSTLRDNINTASLQSTLASLKNLQRASASVRHFASALAAATAGGAVTEEVLSALGEDLVQLLTLIWLGDRSPATYSLLELLGVIEHTRPSAMATPGEPPLLARLAVTRPTLRLERVTQLLRSPESALREWLGIVPLKDEATAREVAERVFGRLRQLAIAAGGMGVVGAQDLPAEIATDEDSALLRSALFMVPLPPVTGAPAALSVEIELVPTHTVSTGGISGPGVKFGLQGSVDIESAALPNIDLRVRLSGEGERFFVAASDSTPATEGRAARLEVTARFLPAREAGGTHPLRQLGAANGTGITFGAWKWSTVVSIVAGAWDADVSIEAEESVLTLSPAEAGGLLSYFLPGGRSQLPLQLGLEWSRMSGVRLHGGAALEATDRPNLRLGPLSINSVHRRVQVGSDGVALMVGFNASLALGPFRATVDGLGLEAGLKFERGNLGVADLDLSHKHPRGVALSVDAGVVVGGGYLFISENREQYAGAVQLELAETLSLSAFGLLNTRMPDGSSGFSLVVLMSATFSPPVQLGYGFTLSGVGGLVGVNRTASVDALRSGLRTGAIGSLLFPADPSQNAPQILSDLATVFPPASGRFLIGPAVQLGWGTPTMVKVSLAVILELPAPVQLIVLGRLEVVLPDEKAAIVALRLDAIGVVDFSSGDVSLDASLFDSRIAGFTVSGDMALRANFGDAPDMVLAIGGFNPRFQPPSGFPALNRVSINLATGDNPRLRLEAYLALTTNTVQFGARLELFAKAGPFSIAGMLELDVLIQLDPFGFIADLGASLALKHKSKSVMAVALDMTLTGPTPWRAWGKASFKVLFFSGAIDFDVQIGGSDKRPELPPPHDLRPLLRDALEEPGNWSTGLPHGEHPLVSLRELVGHPDIFVHPLAQVSLTQRVAPLAREINRFGSTTPQPYRHFTLGIVDADGTVRSTPVEGVDVIQEYFAPAQFRHMTDDEKLTAPAFEHMPAGLRLAPTGFMGGPAIIEPEIAYAREMISRPQRPPTTPSPRGAADRETTSDSSVTTHRERQFGPNEAKRVPAGTSLVSVEFVHHVEATGAAATAPLAQSGYRRFATPATPAVTLREPQFAVVAGRGLHAQIPPALRNQPLPDTELSTAPPTHHDYLSALQGLQLHRQRHPSDLRRHAIVPLYPKDRND